MTGERASRRPNRVVVADAVPLVRQGMGALLATMGFEVVAETARAADLERLVALHRPALVVVGAVGDVPLVDSVRRLRSAATPPLVLLLLAVNQRAALADLLTLECDGIVARAMPAEEILGAVAKLLAGERVIDPAVLGDDTSIEDEPSDASALTTREREVLELLSTGHSNREIASTLFVSLPTVKTHLAHIYAKLNARNRNEALGRAVALGLLH